MAELGMIEKVGNKIKPISGFRSIWFRYINTKKGHHYKRLSVTPQGWSDGAYAVDEVGKMAQVIDMVKRIQWNLP